MPVQGLIMLRQSFALLLRLELQPGNRFLACCCQWSYRQVTAARHSLLRRGQFLSQRCCIQGFGHKKPHWPEQRQSKSCNAVDGMLDAFVRVFQALHLLIQWQT